MNMLNEENFFLSRLGKLRELYAERKTRTECKLIGEMGLRFAREGSAWSVGYLMGFLTAWVILGITWGLLVFGAFTAIAYIGGFLSGLIKREYAKRISDGWYVRIPREEE